MKFTQEQARKIEDRLGIDWNVVSLEQFLFGVNVELEHGLREPQTNITNDDPVLTGKIVWAHLKEYSDYYDRLKAVEDDNE
jgi:hypothetical protein